jgi:hypothetical protein
MPLWLLFTLLALVKLVVAGLMLWLPFRTDAAMSALEDRPRLDAGEDENGEDENGGSKTLQPFGEPHPRQPHPRRPFPRRPRRGPHGEPSHSPPRVRGRSHKRTIARALIQR